MITELVLEQGGEPAAEGELRHVFVASQDDLIEMKRAAGRDVDVADLNELAVMKGIGED